MIPLTEKLGNEFLKSSSAIRRSMGDPCQQFTVSMDILPNGSSEFYSSLNEFKKGIFSLLPIFCKYMPTWTICQLLIENVDSSVL